MPAPIQAIPGIVPVPFFDDVVTEYVVTACIFLWTLMACASLSLVAGHSIGAWQGWAAIGVALLGAVWRMRVNAVTPRASVVALVLWSCTLLASVWVQLWG